MMQDLDRLCLHTITTKAWSIETAVEKYARAGVKGISVWRDTLEGRSIPTVRRQIADAGLSVVSLVRGGFFTALTAAERRAKIDENKRIIDEAAALGAPHVVLVCGATPGQSLETSRVQITEALAELLPYAAAHNVKLAIEPLHPMYADSRSAVNTLKTSNDICVELNHSHIGVAIDVYHVWWEPGLKQEIERCGQLGKIHAFHVCDWKNPPLEFLNDRGLMGEGVINIPEIRSWVEQAGFQGFVEVEIFSTLYWAQDTDQFLAKVIDAYRKHV